MPAMTITRHYTINFLFWFLNRDLPPGFVRRWLGTAVLIVADGTIESDNQRGKNTRLTV